jgi:hypothetical protein
MVSNGFTMSPSSQLLALGMPVAPPRIAAARRRIRIIF